ncbi:mechanosensitive ion channel family protein [Chungangia koreensis]|uniref:Mechanosensitive ion channel family protein n=1 Tax=Chungangia koreensis TaxID=752657 RepID=A0ABV8X8X5_9LACT
MIDPANVEQNYQKAEKVFLSQETWSKLLETSIRIAVIIFLAVIVVNIGKLIMKKIFTAKSKVPLRHSERRKQTLLKLIQNVISYVVYFSAILAVLSEFDIDVKGIIAGAGVIGLAVGFGAQSLVKDVITGFFIIFEDQFSVGDYVKIGTFEGTVEEIGLKTTKIKSFTGEVSILPNGTIAQVINYSVRNSIAIVDVTVSIDKDLELVEKHIKSYLSNLQNKDENIMKEPMLLGVQNMTATDVILRITAETKPMKHYEVARKIRGELKTYLFGQGIDIPQPEMITKSPEDL